jgi:hypothetical protein
LHEKRFPSVISVTSEAQSQAAVYSRNHSESRLLFPMKEKTKKLRIAVFWAGVLSQIAFAQIQTAKVTGGEVQGVVAGGVSIFNGIPFAAPPVGDLRWKAPAPVQAWTGIKKADAFGPACMQAGRINGEHRAGQRSLQRISCARACFPGARGRGPGFSPKKARAKPSNIITITMRLM